MVAVSSPPGRQRDAKSSVDRGVLQGLRIVVVDDDNDARDLLTTVLTQRGAQVYEAECAADAFALVESERPDVLVSDIAMPEEDGYMLIGRVRRLTAERGGTTPAIAVTAYAGGADRARALAAGFDVHFAKPIDVDSLVDKLVALRSAVGPSRAG